MIVGTADVAELASRAATIRSFDGQPLELSRIEILQLATEIEAREAASLYPPALHPTLPPMAVWQIVRCVESPLGSFAMALLRLSCRSGVRPRGYLVGGVIDGEPAGRTLASRFGYSLREGVVQLRRFYDSVEARVSIGERSVLHLAARDPAPLAPTDVQFNVGLHLAHTPKGLRLVQVEPEYHVERAERGKPVVMELDAQAWGNRGLRPTFPVSASVCVGTMTIPPIRFVCRPDVLAFEGTERI
jgi:hypothetical protein